ncbi:hypothetical protein Trydic_g3798 [Trypoxylus dichotomus]
MQHWHEYFQSKQCIDRLYLAFGHPNAVFTIGLKNPNVDVSLPGQTPQRSSIDVRDDVVCPMIGRVRDGFADNQGLICDKESPTTAINHIHLWRKPEKLEQEENA